MDPLTQDQLLKLLSTWPIQFTSVEPYRADRVDMYAADGVTGERYILKNLGELDDMCVRTEAQHRITQHLHRHDIPVGYLLTTREGGFYATDGTDLFVLMPRLPQEDAGLFGLHGHLAFDSLGSAYARLHAALATFDGPVDTWESLLFDRLYEHTAPRLLKALQGEDQTVVQESLTVLKQPMKDLSPDLPSQVILWDCHTGNTLFWNGHVSGFIDVDHISRGPRVFDIANIAANMIVYDQSEMRTKLWLKSLPTYVSAYHRTNPLSAPERKAIPYAIESFTLVLLEHFLTHGGSESAKQATLGAVKWFHDNREAVNTATANAFA